MSAVQFGYKMWIQYAFIQMGTQTDRQTDICFNLQFGEKFQIYTSCLDSIKNVDVVSIHTYNQNYSQMDWKA